MSRSKFFLSHGCTKTTLSKRYILLAFADNQHHRIGEDLSNLYECYVNVHPDALLLPLSLLFSDKLQFVFQRK